MMASRTIHLEGIGPVLLEKSARARRLTMTVIPGKHIRVAVPQRISLETAAAFAEDKKPWLKKVLARIREQRERQKDLAERFANLDIPRAGDALTRRLAELAEKHGYSYGKVIIRNQKTRWGSCSHRNTISLNIKLILVPDDLRDYVMLHELVHTRHHDHGAGFRAELDGLVGDARGIARRLRDYDLRLF